MSVTEITGVEFLPLDRDRLLGFCIDSPVPATELDAYEFVCAGWVLGKTAPVLGVELVGDDGSVRRIPTGDPRPDVVRCHPGAAEAAVPGWRSALSVVGMGAEFELGVQAILKNDRTPVPLARIRGRRSLVPQRFESGIQPLMVTSLARTGTTWLMRMLAEHPAIVAHRFYPYETSPVRHWMQFLGALTEPSPAAASPSALDPPEREWRVPHPFSSASLLLAPATHAWFGRKFVEQTAEFFCRCAEDCYREIAAQQHQPSPLFFAEKHLPYEVPGIVWELYPKAREIFLVRDFRDMLCSIEAFNRKRESQGFARNLAESEEQYIFAVGEKTQRLRKAWRHRKDRACLVRYEDLVFETAGTLGRILEYLGMPADAPEIAGMIRRAAQDTEDLQRHRTSPSLAGSVGRWRRDLRPELHLLCDRAFGPALADFGYGAEAAHR